MTGRSSTPAIVVGAGLAVVGMVLIVSGMGPLGEPRDADGFYMSDPLLVDRSAHAIVTGDIGLLRERYHTLTEGSVVLAFVGEPDDVRMQGVASGPQALFMGIAPTLAIDEYLTGVAHDEITEWDADRAAITDVEYTAHQGTALPGPPAADTFWVASVVGTGQQTLDWTIESGDWTAVVMNADAASPVTAELAFGAAPSSNINAIAWTSLTVGLLALIGGGWLLYRGLRRRDGKEPPFPADAGDEQSSQAKTPEETTAGRL